MYYLALIQNESEMMRYSWADIRPMIHNMNYEYDSFTAENIDTFFVELSKKKYDAIVVAANACNDNNVLKKLEENKDQIKEYLYNGGGLFVSFQMRLANRESYNFLPHEFDVRCTNRIVIGENPKQGSIDINIANNKHTILFYPNEIEIEAVKNQCLHNDNVEGLYWTYLEPIEDGKYDTILEDSTIDSRKLLLVSRETEKPRIVIASLSLDWQMHSDLLSNVLDYAVKGRPITAVIRKRGTSTFEFDYLISNYKSRKMAITVYSMNNLVINKNKSHIHDVYILDPCWSKKEVNKFIKENKDEIINGKYKVILFDNESIIPTYSVVANFKSYKGVISSVLVWLQSLYDPSNPYWQGSFWRTYDVLFAFDYFGIPVAMFKDRIINELDKHDKNGSYDEVLGATCAMYQIYKWLFGEERNERIERTERWILSNMDSKTIFEKATAIDILVSNGVILTDDILNSTKDAIMQQVIHSNNEFAVYRYCKSLYICGFFVEVNQIIEKFYEMQDKRQGKWINLSNTAAILDLLLDVYISIDNTHKEIIEKMILGGVSYIKAHYDEKICSWQLDASCSAKCIVVLEKFEKLIELPIDLALTDTEHSLKWISVNKILKTAIENNRNYISEINELNVINMQQKDELLRLKKSSNRVLIINLIISGVFSVSLALLLLFIAFLNEKQIIIAALKVIKEFVLSNLKSICVTVATVIILVYVYFVSKWKRVPGWLKFVLNRAEIERQDNNEVIIGK